MGSGTKSKALFEAGDASVRVQLFKSLKEPAFFQPLRVLRLIRRALENEAATVQVWSDWQVTQENVLREIPPLLKAIAFHLDHIEEAAGILWRLAQSDRALHISIPITRAGSWKKWRNTDATNPSDTTIGWRTSQRK